MLIPHILDKIVATKKEEVSHAKSKSSLQEVKARAQDAPPALSFLKAFDPKNTDLPELRVIAEIKKASPSGGVIRPQYEPVRIAGDYLEAGAAALSVLTDSVYFQGSLADLEAVRKVSSRPILRKDFMIDAYQIYEARAAGADCILAIVASLEKNKLEDFVGLASELGMTTLVEVHDGQELQVALGVIQKNPLSLLGINNRNLKTLVTDLKTTEELMLKVPQGMLVISESGLKTHADLLRMKKSGVGGFLIGEHLLRYSNLKMKFKEIIGE